MDYIIETINLSKKFPGKLAVNKINMHVAPGDIYGLIGRNGAGKTTAMKMILGNLNPTEGEIRLFGQTNLFEQRKKIGSLIEAPGLYKNCSAYENMKRFSILYGGDEEEINDILNFVGLGNVGKKKVSAYSLGMKQRLGIALALLGKPGVLILDEPVNGLDPAGIKDVRDLILKLNRERGVTFLISSHLLDELGKIATRYGIINNGDLVDEISAEELKEKCRTCLTITVDDVNKAKEILSKQGLLNNYRENGNTLSIYTHIDEPSSINELLIKEGVKVNEISYSSNGFEDYFIERLGR